MNTFEVAGYIGLSLIGACFLWAIWKFHGVAFIYDIRLTEDGIKFVLFFMLRVGFVPFSNIDAVQEVKGGYSYLRAYNFKNRFGHTTFLIRKKRAWFANQVLVTPDDADAFTSSLLRAGVSVKRK